MGGGGQNSGSVHCPSQAEKKSKIILLLQSTDLLLPHSLERLQFWVGAKDRRLFNWSKAMMIHWQVSTNSWWELQSARATFSVVKHDWGHLAGHSTRRVIGAGRVFEAINWAVLHHNWQKLIKIIHETYLIPYFGRSIHFLVLSISCLVDEMTSTQSCDQQSKKNVTLKCFSYFFSLEFIPIGTKPEHLDPTSI